MSGLEIFMGVAGVIATALVVMGMILITPRGEVDLWSDAPESQGDELSRAGARETAEPALRR